MHRSPLSLPALLALALLACGDREQEGFVPSGRTGGACDFRAVSGTATVVEVVPATAGEVIVRYRFASPERQPNHPAVLYENVLEQRLPCAECATSLGLAPGASRAVRAEANVSGGGCAPFMLQDPWDPSACACPG